MAGWEIVGDKPKASGGWEVVNPPQDDYQPTQYGFKVKPININGINTVQREGDNAAYFGPEQGNKGQAGWFNDKGQRVGDAPGQAAPKSFGKSVADNLLYNPITTGGTDLLAGYVVQPLANIPGVPAPVRNWVNDSLRGREEEFKNLPMNQSALAPVTRGVATVASAYPFEAVAGAATGLSQLSNAEKVRGALAAIKALPVGIARGWGAGALFAAGNPVVLPEGSTPADYAKAKVDQIDTGGKYGAAFGAATPAIQAVGGKVMDKVASVNSKALPEEAQRIQDIADKFGVRTLAPDLTKSPGLNKTATLLESVPGSGMVAQRQAQQLEAKAAAQALLDKYGIQGDAAATIQAGLANKLSSGKASAKSAYDLVGQLAEGKGEVPLGETLKTIQKFKAQEASAAIPDQGMVSLLEKLESRLTDPASGVDKSFNGVRGLRSDLGGMITDYYKGTNAATGSKGVHVLQGIKDAIEGDLSGFTSKNGPELAQAAKQADSIYKAQVVPFKDKALAAAVKSSEPDQIYRTFIQQGKGDRAQKFYNALDPNGQAAVRSQMVKDAFDKATEQDGVFSPAKFAQSLEKVKDASGVFFKGADKFELDGFSNLMRHIQRAGQIGENPTNGQRLVQMLIAGEGVGSLVGAATGNPAALAAPAASMAGSRALTKLFASPKGKSLLLAASGSTPGSPVMTNLVEKEIPKFLGIETPKNVIPFKPAGAPVAGVDPLVAQKENQ